MKPCLLIVLAVCVVLSAYSQQATYWYKIGEIFDHQSEYRSTVKGDFYYRVTVTPRGAMLLADVKTEAQKHHDGAFLPFQGKEDGILNFVHVLYLENPMDMDFMWMNTYGIPSIQQTLLLSEDYSRLNYTSETKNTFSMEPTKTFIGFRVEEPVFDRAEKKRSMF